MPKRTDLTGQRFGRLVVKSYAYTDSSKKAIWVCMCDCGKNCEVRANDLLRGKTNSCGCLKRDTRITMNLTHGGKHTRLYNIWIAMLERTGNKNSSNYHNYGGRGIAVCEEWKNDFEQFRNWATSHGYREDLTIDRIDVNGDYCPENCRWATKKEQANGTRRNIKIEYKGQTLTLSQWAEKIGINRYTLRNRIFVYGWSVEEAFETPVGERRKK